MVAGPLAHLMPPDGGMAFVFFEGGLLPSNANSEHQTASWTPPLGISIRALSSARTRNLECNSLLNLNFLVS